MEIDVVEARRILRWQRLATNTGGMDGEDTVLIARIRAAFPILVKEEQFIKAAAAISLQVESDPRVVAVRDRIKTIPLNSPDYDRGLDKLMAMKARVEKELMGQQEDL